MTVRFRRADARLSELELHNTYRSGPTWDERMETTPDEVRDDVLARLLELNRQRALEEGQLPAEVPVFAGADVPKPENKRRQKKGGKRSSGEQNMSLLPAGDEEP